MHSSWSFIQHYKLTKYYFCYLLTKVEVKANIIFLLFNFSLCRFNVKWLKLKWFYSSMLSYKILCKSFILLMNTKINKKMAVLTINYISYDCFFLHTSQYCMCFIFYFLAKPILSIQPVSEWNFTSWVLRQRWKKTSWGNLGL